MKSKAAVLMMVLLSFATPRIARAQAQHEAHLPPVAKVLMLTFGTMSIVTTGGDEKFMVAGWALLLAVAADTIYDRFDEKRIRRAQTGEQMALPVMTFDRLDVKKTMDRDCRIAATNVKVLIQSAVASVAEKMDFLKSRSSTEARIQDLCLLYRRVADLSESGRAGGVVYSKALALQAAGLDSLSETDEQIIHNMFAVQGLF